MSLSCTTWTTGTTEAHQDRHLARIAAALHQPPSPCHQAFPVNGDIAEWIGLARAHDFHGAWQVLTRHNPFPAVAGRHLPSPM